MTTQGSSILSYWTSDHWTTDHWTTDYWTTMMNWFKQGLNKLMFWKDDPATPEYEITDCWPDLPPEATLADEATLPESDVPEALANLTDDRDPTGAAGPCCEPGPDVERPESS